MCIQILHTKTQFLRISNRERNYKKIYIYGATGFLEKYGTKSLLGKFSEYLCFRHLVMPNVLVNSKAWRKYCVFLRLAQNLLHFVTKFLNFTMKFHKK